MVQDWLITRVCPYLLDPAVLPNTYVSRPILGTDARWLCNPYQYPHARPYWFGRLESIGLDNYLRRRLTPGDTFVDVGANCGQYSVLASALVGPRGRVLSFEPSGSMFRKLQTHVDEMRIENIEVFNKALGEREVECELQFNCQSPGSSTFQSRREGVDQIEVENCTMVIGDHLLAETKFPGSMTLKVDVEGFELSVIRGLASTIRNRASAVIVEVSPQWIGGLQGVTEMWNIFRESEFEAKIITEGTEPRVIDVDEIPLDRQCDVVFEKLRMN
jgi:FkbM family methyltransferase